MGHGARIVVTLGKLQAAIVDQGRPGLSEIGGRCEGHCGTPWDSPVLKIRPVEKRGLAGQLGRGHGNDVQAWARSGEAYDNRKNGRQLGLRQPCK